MRFDVYFASITVPSKKQIIILECEIILNSDLLERKKQPFLLETLFT